MVEELVVGKINGLSSINTDGPKFGSWDPAEHYQAEIPSGKTNIFIVTSGEYGENGILAVFSTRVSAEVCKEILEAEFVKENIHEPVQIEVFLLDGEV